MSSEKRAGHYHGTVGGACRANRAVDTARRDILAVAIEMPLDDERWRWCYLRPRESSASFPGAAVAALKPVVAAFGICSLTVLEKRECLTLVLRTLRATSEPPTIDWASCVGADAAASQRSVIHSYGLENE